MSELVPYFVLTCLIKKASIVTDNALAIKNKSYQLNWKSLLPTPSTNTTPPSIIKDPAHSFRCNFCLNTIMVIKFAIIISVFNNTVPVLIEPCFSPILANASVMNPNTPISNRSQVTFPCLKRSLTSFFIKI